MFTLFFSRILKAFAKRALSKINELHELELMSVNGDKVSQMPQFRDATTKVLLREIIWYFFSYVSL